MEPEIIFTHPKLILSYYKDEAAILETWNGFTDYTVFSELLGVILSKLVEKNAHNLILDTRQHKGLSPEAQQYGATTCIEHAKKYGPIKHAIIIPENAFSKLSVNNFVKNVDNENGNLLVINAYFTEVEQALVWMGQD
ncbi:MAG: hypothetical protein GX587_13455 [Bacteroidales bacterium]|nr:hypothetical protein [Bacteroidales bacterium]